MVGANGAAGQSCSHGPSITTTLPQCGQLLAGNRFAEGKATKLSSAWAGRHGEVLKAHFADCRCNTRGPRETPTLIPNIWQMHIPPLPLSMVSLCSENVRLSAQGKCPLVW